MFFDDNNLSKVPTKLHVSYDSPIFWQKGNRLNNSEFKVFVATPKKDVYNLEGKRGQSFLWNLPTDVKNGETVVMG